MDLSYSLVCVHFSFFASYLPSYSSVLSVIIFFCLSVLLLFNRSPLYQSLTPFIRFTCHWLWLQSLPSHPITGSSYRTGRCSDPGLYLLPLLLLLRCGLTHSLEWATLNLLCSSDHPLLLGIKNFALLFFFIIFPFVCLLACLYVSFDPPPPPLFLETGFLLCILGWPRIHYVD